jgi:glycosyltransferase involved in cell wall biosynthesis
MFHMSHSQPLRVLVVTVVHDPRDSRIWFRQIDALLERGWHVTYAAPFSADAELATAHMNPETTHRLRLMTLPRARGRARLRAAMTVRRMLRRERGRHDVVLIHDPELLAAAFGLKVPHLVWDVHEDTAAALQQKDWLPAAFRGATAGIVRLTERWAEERFTLILAETSYQRRFRRPHAVVPNAVVVPEDVPPVGEDRVVYLGSLTPARGSNQLPTIGRMLKSETQGRISLEVIGQTYDEATTNLMLEAHANQDLVWRGFLPADQALGRVRGALAGLSLLSDTPNFRHSVPTKIVEYCAYGVPVITTPLPTAARLVERSGSGVVVPWDDPQAVVDAVIRLSRQAGAAQEMGRRGYHLATTEFDWAHWSNVFADQLESVAGSVRYPAS